MKWDNLLSVLKSLDQTGFKNIQRLNGTTSRPWLPGNENDQLPGTGVA